MPYGKNYDESPAYGKAHGKSSAKGKRVKGLVAGGTSAIGRGQGRRQSAMDSIMSQMPSNVRPKKPAAKKKY